MKDKKLLAFIGIGFELVGFVLVGLWIGQALDKQYGLSGIATGISIMVALIVWIVHLTLLMKNFEKNP